MQKAVIGVFDSVNQAERTINSMRQKGFDKERISIVAKNYEEQDMENQDINNADVETDSIVDGTTTGGVIGALAGLAIGAGALAVPGLGPIIAAGPIAGLLSGAATGGVAGGLIDLGIPAERGEYYENEVRQGRILVVTEIEENKVQDAADIMRQNGAYDVETH